MEIPVPGSELWRPGKERNWAPISTNLGCLERTKDGLVESRRELGGT